MQFRKSKAAEIKKILEERLRRGEYKVNAFPSDRKLADEMGVSYLTARKAVSELFNLNMLIKNDSGRTIVNPELHQNIEQKQVALLIPSHPSQGIMEWSKSVWRATKEMNANLRIFAYNGGDDKIILETLSRDFDAFLFYPSRDISQFVKSKLVEIKKKVCTIFEDYREYGIPMIEDVPASAMNDLLTHMFELNHRNIDCITVKTNSKNIQNRVRVWKSYLERKKMNGNLIELQNLSHELIYKFLKQYLLDTKNKNTAFVSVNFMIAPILQRVAYDLNISLGQDTSFGCLGVAEDAKYLIPSMTVINPPDKSIFVKQALQYMLESNTGVGPLTFEPSSVELFIGESTGFLKKDQS